MDSAAGITGQRTNRTSDTNHDGQFKGRRECSPFYEPFLTCGFWKNCRTRMHSSRMRTGRTLTVFRWRTPPPKIWRNTPSPPKNWRPPGPNTPPAPKKNLRPPPTRKFGVTPPSRKFGGNPPPKNWRPPWDQTPPPHEQNE